MFAIVLVATQFLFLAFVGGFARTTQTLSSSYYLGTNILFLLAWTLMNCPFKKLTLTTLTILILTVALSVQCNLLFGRFWYNIFNSFTTSYEITIDILIQCTMSVFVVLLIAIDYIGIFRYWQIYMLIVPIISFLWTFNHAVFRYGLKIFDGGCGLDVFLFSGVVTLVLWVIAVRTKHDRYGGYNKNNQNIFMKQNMYKRQQYYNGYSISLFGGLIGTFLLWPSFNYSLSTLSSTLSIVDTAILSSSIFSNSAYGNTILALSIGTVLSFTFHTRNSTHQQKQKIRCTIDCFINSGIICASFIDISLNPSSVMTMALIASILTLILYWYYQSLDLKEGKTVVVSNFMILVLYFSRAIFRVLLTLIGIIVTAIIVSNRQYSTVGLLNTVTYGSTIYAKTAGLQFAGYFVTLGISLVAGVLCGFAVNLFHFYKQNEAQKSNIPKQLKSKQSQNYANNAITKKKTTDISRLDTARQSVVIASKNQQKKTLREPQLTDFTFLQFGQNDNDIFPLFLNSNDVYNDEQQTARKMLKQAMLSHVKNNYISTNNYISIKNINNQTNNTNNAQNNINDPHNNQTRKKGSKSLQIENDFILKNNHRYETKQSKIQYANKLGDTPKSGTSQIKNQTKEIVSLVNKDMEVKNVRSKSREAMPQFYIDHLKNSRLKANNSQMNRSNTQKYIKSQINKSNIRQRAPRIIPNSNIESELKKTKSLSSIGLSEKEEPKKKVKNEIHIISQQQKQEQQYRSRNININNLSRKLEFEKPLKLTTSKYEEKSKQNAKVKDDGSQILDQNQHVDSEFEDQQIL